MRPFPPHLFATCLAAALLAACSAPEPQAAPADAPASPPAPVAEPAAPATPAQAQAPEGKRPPGQEHEPVLAYRAFGNEPFWSVHVEGDTLVFSTPDEQPGRTLHGRRVASVRGVSYQGKDGDVGFNLDIQEADCNDGMSDNEYTLESTFTYGETTYKGCAEQAKAK